MHRRWLFVLAELVLVLGGGYVAFVGRANALPPSGKPAFAGDSKDLKHTQVVATLDTPVENGKNVIWCASFQAAWKQLQDKLAKGPVGLEGGPVVAEALNLSYAPGPELPPGRCTPPRVGKIRGLSSRFERTWRSSFPGPRSRRFRESRRVLLWPTRDCRRRPSLPSPISRAGSR